MKIKKDPVRLCEIDSSKTYLCKVIIPDHYPHEQIGAYMNAIKEAFVHANCTNIIFVPENSNLPLIDLTSLQIKTEYK